MFEIIIFCPSKILVTHQIFKKMLLFLILQSPVVTICIATFNPHEAESCIITFENSVLTQRKQVIHYKDQLVNAVR